MAKKVRICAIPRPAGGEIIVVDPAGEPIKGRWHAQRVINALRTRLPLEQIAWDIVVLGGETAAPAAFGSSPDAESFIRAMMPQLSDYKYQVRELDW
jgi:hypothetical protein